MTLILVATGGLVLLLLLSVPLARSIISGRITEVADASAASAEAVNQARDSSTEVARSAEALRTLVSQFRI